MLELASLYAELRKRGLTKDHLRAYCVNLVLAQDITVRELVAEVTAFSERPAPPAPDPGKRTLRVAAAVKYLEGQGVTIFTAEMVTEAACRLPGEELFPSQVARELSALSYSQVLNGEQVRTFGKLRRLWSRPSTAIVSKVEAIAAFEKPYGIWQTLDRDGYPGLGEES